MRWHFTKSGWPESAKVDGYAASPDEATQGVLIDTLQDWKTDHYKDLIGSGAVETRPGVLKLMDSARAKGLKVAVCSAATKDAALFTVASLLGKERFAARFPRPPAPFPRPPAPSRAVVCLGASALGFAASAPPQPDPLLGRSVVPICAYD